MRNERVKDDGGSRFPIEKLFTPDNRLEISTMKNQISDNLLEQIRATGYWLRLYHDHDHDHESNRTSTRHSVLFPRLLAVRLSVSLPKTRTGISELKLDASTGRPNRTNQSSGIQDPQIGAAEATALADTAFGIFTTATIRTTTRYRYAMP